MVPFPLRCLSKRCGGSTGNKRNRNKKSEIGRKDAVEQMSELLDIVAGRERGEHLGSSLYGLL
jgi:hypothetical protein